MDLDALFRPRSVAVVGASTRGAGATVLATLETLGYQGRVELVNPRLKRIGERCCYASIADLPDSVDAAVIALRADRCTAAVAECAARGIPAAVVFANPFSAPAEQGSRIHAEISAAAQDKVAVLGPNCMGFFAPAYGTALYLDRVQRPIRVGTVALVTQSGSVGVGGLNHTGTLALSLMVSVGNEAVVTTADIVRYLLQDDVTRVIALHQEGFADPQGLLAAADEAFDLGVPIVLCKTGRSSAGARAAASHTAAVASDDRVVRAVFGARGVTVVGDLDELFAAAEILATGRHLGPRVAAFTLSGGHVGLLCDAAASTGLEFPEPDPHARRRVEEALGEPRGVANPLDTWPSAGEITDVFSAALPALASDASYDAFLVAVDTPADPPTSPAEMASALAAAVARAAADDRRLWLMTSTLIAADDPAVVARLRAAGIPRLNGLRATLDALSAIVSTKTMPRVDVVSGWRDGFPQTEPETYEALAKFDVPVVRHRLCCTIEEGLEAAGEFGYPVVLKLVDRATLHKTEAGGVVLGIQGEVELEQAFRAVRSIGGEGVLVAAQAPEGVDAFVGGKVDVQFGPVVAFGLGGFAVEVLGDLVVLPAPVGSDIISTALVSTKLGQLLDGFRGSVLDRDALCHAIAGVSQLIASLRDTPGVALDVNPIRVHATGAVAVDAKVELPAYLARPEPDEVVA